MKILSIKNISRIAGATALATICVTQPSHANTNLKPLTEDVFSYTEKVPAKGTTDSLILANAPIPEVTIAGEKKNVIFVVKLDENVLYQYNEDGKATNAYLVASGKPSTPTQKGIRVVSYVDYYPYKSAPETTKRHKNPNAYGPRAIILETIDSETGKKGITGQFIHGNNNAKSLGTYASLGCIRMDNDIIKDLAKLVKRGDLVLIK